MEKSMTHPGIWREIPRGSVAADVIGSAVEVDEPLMAAGMDRAKGGGWGGGDPEGMGNLWELKKPYGGLMVINIPSNHRKMVV